jgi:fructokinase
VSTLAAPRSRRIVLDSDGRTLWRERVATPAGDYEATLASVASLIANAEASVGGGPRPVGVGHARQSDRRRQHQERELDLPERPPALPADLARLLGRPVRIANDANCLALSEAPTVRAPATRSCSQPSSAPASARHRRRRSGLLTGPNGLAWRMGTQPTSMGRCR